MWPYRVVASGPYPGISLVVSPLVNGLLADALGRWRENRDRPRTYLSTFWGGALFAFGMAGVRFWLMGAADRRPGGRPGGCSAPPDAPIS